MELNAATRLVAGETKDKAEVTRFCKLYNIHLNGQYNTPTLYKERGDLVESFDSWAEAKAFLLKQLRAYQDSAKKGPWLD